MEIADDTSKDTIIGEKGEPRPNSEWIARSRLQIETRLKLLAKWDPKRYGENPEIRDEPPAPTMPDGSAGIILTPAILEDLLERRKRALASRLRIENQALAFEVAIGQPGA